MFIAGKYKLEVLWGDHPVEGSPFSVDVFEQGGAKNILVNTDSLKFGIIGQELQTVIDTRLAEAG